MTTPVRSAIFSKQSAIWLFGVVVMAHEIFVVPPAQLRIVPLLIGAVMAQVSGLEIARALWNGGAALAAPPAAPPSPPATLPPGASPPATPSSAA